MSVLPRGRPLLLGSLDQMVQRFLLSLRRTGGLVSCAVAISVAKTLMAQNPQYNLSHINLDSSHWAQSLFWRIRRVKSRFQKVPGKRLNCYIFTTSSRLSFINHEFGPNSLKVHACNESHYGKTKL